MGDHKMTPADHLTRIARLCVRIAQESECPVCLVAPGERHREDCAIGAYVAEHGDGVADTEPSPPPDVEDRGICGFPRGVGEFCELEPWHVGPCGKGSRVPGWWTREKSEARG